ncbi:MAG: hypothetical protein IOB84_13740 [Brevundimonas sp.]|nr:hypothetical protein [Brevundimonas sp.]
MTDRPTNAELLCQAGQAMFGETWQSDLARLLNVSLRRVQYYAAGARQPPDSMLAEMAGHLEAKAGECKALAATLRKSVKPKT